MKELLASHLKNLRIYSLYYAFVVYFAPLFSTIMVGYYFNNPAIGNMFAQSRDFMLLSKIIILLIVCLFLGKLLSDLAGYILGGLRLLLFWFGLLVFTLTKWFKRFEIVQRFRKMLQSHLGNNHHSVSDLDINLVILNQEELKPWYSRIKMTAVSFQTAFGSFLVLFFLADVSSRPAYLAILVILVILTYSARIHQQHAEEIILKQSN